MASPRTELEPTISDRGFSGSDNIDEADSPAQPLMARPSRSQQPKNYGGLSTKIQGDGSVQGNTAEPSQGSGAIQFDIAPRLGISFTLSALAVNMSLSILTVISQVGMMVLLPMFSSALQSHVICGEQKAVGDVYFLLLYSCFWFVVAFGLLVLLARLLNPSFSLSCSVSHRNRILLGSFTMLNGILVVFSSPEDRTPVFLQPLLSTVIIPFTVGFSYLMLRKKESVPRLICCLAVVVGLIISTEPVIFNIDGQGSGGAVKTKPIVRFAWSCVFMVGFIPLAINNVVQEKIMHRAKKTPSDAASADGEGKEVSPLLLMFWINVWMFVMYAVLFWVDFIPVFGTVNGLSEFSDHMTDGFRCMMGNPRGPSEYYVDPRLNCSATIDDPLLYNPDPNCSLPVTYCWLFVVLYCLANLFSLMLIKYAASAVYLVVVQGLITPLGAIFWYLFQMDDTAHVSWHPVYYKHASNYTIVGLFFIVPAVMAYNTIGMKGAEKKVARRMPEEP